jgi:hypothetical protein
MKSVERVRCVAGGARQRQREGEKRDVISQTLAS